MYGWKKYEIAIARKCNKIIGYAIFCDVVKENVPSIAILDISCLKKYNNLSNAIIAKIKDYAIENHAEIIMIMATKHVSKFHGLIKNGFFRSPYKFYLIIKNLGNSYLNSFLNNEKNWHLTWIDSDNF